MNWTMLSAIGDILSSAAVLVTLIYLAMQTRQSANATQSNTRQAILAADQQLLQLIVDNPDLYLVRFKPKLTDEEKVRLGAYLVTFVRMRENNWLQYQNGVLDEATWGSYRKSIVPFLGAPKTRTWWQNYARETSAFDPAFIALVDELLANAPAQEQPPWLSAVD
jgi:hypothetical protein